MVKNYFLKENLKLKPLYHNSLLQIRSIYFILEIKKKKLSDDYDANTYLSKKPKHTGYCSQGIKVFQNSKLLLINFPKRCHLIKKDMEIDICFKNLIFVCQTKYLS